MSDRIIVETRDHVADVMLNRGAKHNAIDHAMFQAIIDTGEVLARDRSLRAVVLRGDGESFCAGIDLSVFQGDGIASDVGEKLRPRGDSPANYYQLAAYAWREIPVPVIAALQGAVFGGGLQIALGADIRYATASAQLSVMEIKWGIIPDMAITTTLPYLMPIDRAAELAWTGRVISGAEAADCGLVTGVREDPLAAARELARTIAGRSPDAVRAIKKLFYDSWHDSPAASLRREADLQMKVMSLPNQGEAVMAAMQKREPDFDDAAI
jgi:enoyl-CoA hydratase/carnithine racemase